jgi:hypothetical protein
LRDEASAAQASKRIHFGNVITMKQGSQLFGLFLRQADPNWIPFWSLLGCAHRQHHPDAPFYTPTKLFAVKFLTGRASVSRATTLPVGHTSIAGRS